MYALLAWQLVSTRDISAYSNLAVGSDATLFLACNWRAPLTVAARAVDEPAAVVVSDDDDDEGDAGSVDEGKDSGSEVDAAAFSMASSSFAAVRAGDGASSVSTLSVPSVVVKVYRLGSEEFAERMETLPVSYCRHFLLSCVCVLSR